MPRIGLAAYDISGPELVELGVAADRAGFDSLWLGEHLFAPLGYASAHPTADRSGFEYRPSARIVEPTTELVDPLVALAAVAARTERITLATGIYLLPLRHPLLVARAARTLSELAGGRFSLGVGSGWLREEFDALGVPFASRVERLEEMIAILRQAWRAQPFAFAGSHFRFDRIQVGAAPVVVPLILGGNSEAALRRAVALGDGWFSSGTPDFDEARQLRDRLDALRSEGGQAGPFATYFRVGGCDPAAVARYGDEGFEQLVLWAEQVWVGKTVEEKQSRLAAAATELGLEPS